MLLTGSTNQILYSQGKNGKNETCYHGVRLLLNVFKWV